jgi:hypothetical protein
LYSFNYVYIRARRGEHVSLKRQASRCPVKWPLDDFKLLSFKPQKNEYNPGVLVSEDDKQKKNSVFARIQEVPGHIWARIV